MAPSNKLVGRERECRELTVERTYGVVSDGNEDKTLASQHFRDHIRRG